MYSNGYHPAMARQKKVVTLTLDPGLWGELMAWIAKQEIRHPKNAVVERALRKFLDGNTNDDIKTNKCR